MRFVGLIDRKFLHKLALIVSLLIFSAYLRFLGLYSSSVFGNRFYIFYYSLIYLGIIIYWGISLRKRICQPQTLRLLLHIVVLLLFLFMIRTGKFIILKQDPHLERLSWYLYYLPLISIPQISFLVAMSLGEVDSYRLPSWVAYLYLVSLALFLLVLTNDYHQLVFSFPQGLEKAEQIYNYGPVYWLIFFWDILLLAGTLLIILIKSRVPQSKKILYLPFFHFIIGILYTILYVLGFKFLRVIAGDVVAFYTIIIMAIFESIIQSGLIRSNTYYEGLFHASGLNLKIVDDSEKVLFETGQSQRDFYSSYRISRLPIAGGSVVLTEDIGEIQGLIEELEELNERLSEENYLLQAEMELKERRIEVDERVRIHDKLSRTIKGLLEKLDELVSDNKETDLDKKLAGAYLVGMLIKRRSHLLILEEEKNFFMASELDFALREIVEGLEVLGIEAALKSDCKGKVQAEKALLAFEAFEKTLTSLLFQLSNLFINLEISRSAIRLKMSMDFKTGAIKGDVLDLIDIKNLEGILEEKAGYLSISREASSLVVNIAFPEEGGVK